MATCQPGKAPAVDICREHTRINDDIVDRPAKVAVPLHMRHDTLRDVGHNSSRSPRKVAAAFGFVHVCANAWKSSLWANVQHSKQAPGNAPARVPADTR